MSTGLPCRMFSQVNIDDFFIILVKKKKMERSDIKNKFHSLIDRTDNDALLMKFYDLMIKSTTSKEGKLYGASSLPNQ
jgi:hypothetical protein